MLIVLTWRYIDNIINGVVGALTLSSPVMERTWRQSASGTPVKWHGYAIAIARGDDFVPKKQGEERTSKAHRVEKFAHLLILSQLFHL